MSAGRCPHCNRAVMWCKTRAGKNIPLDPRPDRLGTLIPFRGRAWWPVELAVLGEPWSDMAGAGAHIVHMRSCPAWPRPEPQRQLGSAQGHLACMQCGTVDSSVRHYGGVDLCRDCAGPDEQVPDGLAT